MSAGSSIPQGKVSGYNVKNVPQFTPEQMQMFQKLIGMFSGQGSGAQGIGKGVDWLSKLAGGGDEGFEELEKPAYSAFNKEIGNIGSRFSGFGSGSLDSSAFQNATSGAARELGENLGAQRTGIRNQAIEKLLGLNKDLMNQRPYDTFLEKQRGWGDTAGDIFGFLQQLIGLGSGAKGLFGGGK